VPVTAQLLYDFPLTGNVGYTIANMPLRHIKLFFWHLLTSPLLRPYAPILQEKSAIALPHRLGGKDCLLNFVGVGFAINECLKLRPALDTLHFRFVAELANEFSRRILSGSSLREISAKTCH
jgi:hypothetical protein